MSNEAAMASKQTRKTQTRARRTTAKSARGKSSKSSSRKRWSARVTKHSNALDLQSKVFKGTPSQIAKSLKRSAEHSRRRKASPYQSAMSMLNFYINRAGKNLSATQRKKLQVAKTKLREEFGRAA
jgi:Protein of unknown function (DUF3175)